MNLLSLAVSVGSRPFIFAAVVGSKLPLSASPSLIVCRTLQLRGVDHIIKLRQDFFGAQSRSVLRRDKLLLFCGFWYSGRVFSLVRGGQVGAPCGRCVVGRRLYGAASVSTAARWLFSGLCRGSDIQVMLAGNGASATR